ALAPATARTGRKPRSAGGERKMKLLLIFGGAVAAVGLFLLATASADTTFFAQQYPRLLALNAARAALLAGVVGCQPLALVQRSRAGADAVRRERPHDDEPEGVPRRGAELLVEHRGPRRRPEELGRGVEQPRR